MKERKYKHFWDRERRQMKEIHLSQQEDEKSSLSCWGRLLLQIKTN